MGSLVKVQNAVVKKVIEGREKPVWINIGKLFVFEDGQSLQLDTVPVGSWWDGKVSFFDQKDWDDKPKQIPDEETEQEAF